MIAIDGISLVLYKLKPFLTYFCSSVSHAGSQALEIVLCTDPFRNKIARRIGRNGLFA